MAIHFDAFGVIVTEREIAWERGINAATPAPHHTTAQTPATVEAPELVLVAAAPAKPARKRNAA